ncbi:MAG: hypothetical protein IMZ50_05955 [Candidatus Atribacteria bacterium]|nr:hypothetical protein [Candidatus Atribacteria bacterium]
MKQVCVWMCGNTIKYLIPDENEEKEAEGLREAFELAHREKPVVQILNYPGMQFSTRYIIGWRINDYEPDAITEMAVVQKQFLAKAMQEFREGESWRGDGGGE